MMKDIKSVIRKEQKMLMQVEELIPENVVRQKRF